MRGHGTATRAGHPRKRKRPCQVLAVRAEVDDSDPVTFDPGFQVVRDTVQIGRGHLRRADVSRKAVRSDPGFPAWQGRRVLAQEPGVAPEPAAAGPGHRDEIAGVRGGPGVTLQARLPVLPVL